MKNNLVAKLKPVLARGASVAFMCFSRIHFVGLELREMLLCILRQIKKTSFGEIRVKISGL